MAGNAGNITSYNKDDIPVTVFSYQEKDQSAEEELMKRIHQFESQMHASRSSLPYDPSLYGQLQSRHLFSGREQPKTMASTTIDQDTIAQQVQIIHNLTQEVTSLKYEIRQNRSSIATNSDRIQNIQVFTSSTAAAVASSGGIHTPLTTNNNHQHNNGSMHAFRPGDDHQHHCCCCNNKGSMAGERTITNSPGWLDWFGEMINEWFLNTG